MSSSCKPFNLNPFLSSPAAASPTSLEISSLDSRLVSFHHNRLQSTRELARAVTLRLYSFPDTLTKSSTCSDPLIGSDKMNNIRNVSIGALGRSTITPIKTNMANRDASHRDAKSPVDVSSPSSTSSKSGSSGSVFSEPSSITTVFVNDILYSGQELRAMAEELDLAQRAGEFPSTKYLNANSNMTVDDYKRLLEMRSAASKVERDALLVALTRDLRERDDEMDERLERQRALKHVNSCIRSVQEEQRLYRIMQTALSHNTHAVTKNDIQELLVSSMANKRDLAGIANLLDIANRLSTTVASKSDLAEIASKSDLSHLMGAINANSDRDIELFRARLDLVSRQVEAMQNITEQQVGALTKQVEQMTAVFASLPTTLTGIMQSFMCQDQHQQQQGLQNISATQDPSLHSTKAVQSGYLCSYQPLAKTPTQQAIGTTWRRSVSQSLKRGFAKMSRRRNMTAKKTVALSMRSKPHWEAGSPTIYLEQSLR